MDRRTPNRSHHELAGARILVVEDERLILMELEAILEDAGAAIAGTALPAALAGIAVIVIHGSGEDPALLLTVTAMRSATIRRTASTPSSTSPPTSGGMSGSNVHIVSRFQFCVRVRSICSVLPLPPRSECFAYAVQKPCAQKSTAAGNQ